jgi:Synergist-CTERM protein sorting domain-containing protein
MGNNAGRKTVLLVLLVFGLILALGGVSMAATTYTVDESQDYDAISAVIQSADEGDTIIFNDGTYNLTGSIRVQVSGLTLQSETRGGAKLYQDGYPIFEIDDGCAITIDGFYMGTVNVNDYNGILHNGGAPSGPVTITNNELVGFDYSIEALFDTASQVLTITGNTFRNCNEGPYLSVEGWTVNISDNVFEDCDFGIEIGSSGPTFGSENVQITGNTITASAGSECSYGIYLEDAGGGATLEISGNTIEGDYEYGIYFEAIGADGTNRSTTLVEKNRILVAGTGLHFGELFNNAPGDLKVRYNTIETNADDNEESGIYVDTFNDADSTVTFRDNNLIGDTGVNSWGFATMATVLIDAQGNWWGDASGPYDDKALPGTPNYNNLDGQGKKVTPYIDYANWRTSAWEEEGDDSSSGCSTGILNPLFLLLLAPLGLLRRKSR